MGTFSEGKCACSLQNLPDLRSSLRSLVGQILGIESLFYFLLFFKMVFLILEFFIDL